MRLGKFSFSRGEITNQGKVGPCLSGCDVIQVYLTVMSSRSTWLWHHPALPEWTSSRSTWLWCHPGLPRSAWLWRHPGLPSLPGCGIVPVCPGLPDYDIIQVYLNVTPSRPIQVCLTVTSGTLRICFHQNWETEGSNACELFRSEIFRVCVLSQHGKAWSRFRRVKWARP